MPIWFLLVAVVLFPMLVSVICRSVGVEPVGTLGLAVAVTLGPLTALITRAVAAAAPAAVPLPLAGWVEWTFTVAPAPLAAAMLGWGVYHSRRAAADPPPAAWCVRCAATLHTDHAGRYYSDADNYLCPPEFHLAGGRRHQPGDRPDS